MWVLTKLTIHVNSKDLVQRSIPHTISKNSMHLCKPNEWKTGSSADSENKSQDDNVKYSHNQAFTCFCQKATSKLWIKFENKLESFNCSLFLQISTPSSSNVSRIAVIRNEISLKFKQMLKLTIHFL